jgi:hypothetical protein
VRQLRAIAPSGRVASWDEDAVSREDLVGKVTFRLGGCIFDLVSRKE